MSYKYAFQTTDKSNYAFASATNLRISLKKAYETCKAINGKKVSAAISFLEQVEKLDTVVPYRKYNAEMAHQRGKGIDTGGFPVKVAIELLRLIKAAEKNAKEKELSGDLYLASVSARKGTGRYHPGRYSGRAMKSTNLEVVVGVRAKPKKEAKANEVRKQW